MSKLVSDLSEGLALPRPLGSVAVAPTDEVFGSPYGVTAAAGAAVGVALGAIAVLDAVRRGGEPEPVRVDGRHAAVLYHSERLLQAASLDNDDLWGVVTGTHRSADGWLRIHANLEPHRIAALEVLGVPADRDAVVEAVRRWPSQELEDAIVAAGGVAAALRTREEWRAHPQGRAVGGTPLVASVERAEGAGLAPGRLLQGVRVLDLTRVIAGPVAGRCLASAGADVLRVDGPLDDGRLLEVDTSLGKRRVSLDLRTDVDRRTFDTLLAGADVLLHAFRPGALATLGYGSDELQRHRPGLVVGSLSAYGTVGPWGQRRGFDSVVQVAAGLAAVCGTPDGAPGALPAQALDHSSGYLLAAGVSAALARRELDGVGSDVEVSLARTADWLEALPATGAPSVPALPAEVTSPSLMRTQAPGIGAVTHVRPPGRIGDRDLAWCQPPALRGRRDVTWESR